MEKEPDDKRVRGYTMLFKVTLTLDSGRRVEKFVGAETFEQAIKECGYEEMTVIAVEKVAVLRVVSMEVRELNDFSD